ncbi:unnamed protein product [Closterium sp. NIES-64]|nr:unnamed protein product [Closterium sp. NIES-64]CAI5997583.1 unnamed protein product [Closterium sp. NIES-64]
MASQHTTEVLGRMHALKLTALSDAQNHEGVDVVDLLPGPIWHIIFRHLLKKRGDSWGAWQWGGGSDSYEENSRRFGSSWPVLCCGMASTRLFRHVISFCVSHHHVLLPSPFPLPPFPFAHLLLYRHVISFSVRHHHHVLLPSFHSTHVPLHHHHGAISFSVRVTMHSLFLHCMQRTTISATAHLTASRFLLWEHEPIPLLVNTHQPRLAGMLSFFLTNAAHTSLNLQLQSSDDLPSLARLLEPATLSLTGLCLDVWDSPGPLLDPAFLGEFQLLQQLELRLGSWLLGNLNPATFQA